MRRIIFFTILGLAGVTYLWWSYAHIYNFIGTHYQAEPTERVYTVGTGTPLTYVALGDSLTAGVGATKKEETYPYAYAEKFGRAVQVTNLGIPGATAADVLTYEVPKLMDLGPVVVTLMIGTNDIGNFVPLATYRKTVEKIIGAAKAPGTSVMVISIPNISDPALVAPPYRWYFSFQRTRFNSALKDICATGACTFISLAPVDKNFLKDGPYYSADKFHPSGEGYALWSSILSEHVPR